MTDLPCACPVTNVQAMGAVRPAGLIWVADLKRDPHAPGLPEQNELSRPSGLGASLHFYKVCRDRWAGEEFQVSKILIGPVQRGMFFPSGDT